MSDNHVIDQSDQKLIEQALGKRISRGKITSDIDRDPETKKLFDTFSPEDQEKIIAKVKHFFLWYGKQFFPFTVRSFFSLR